MLTSEGHLTYCTNIHAGNDWPDHFASLKENFPLIKNDISPNASMAIGLRLSNEASVALADSQKFEEFKRWLAQEDAYVFTMNGFPYGEFHNTVVKDQVHTPDWTTPERLSYTLRLADILLKLLPEGMDGGISTSPLSYRYWFDTEEAKEKATISATQNIIAVVEHMYKQKLETAKVLHLDIEPEPDGMLETGPEFLNWYNDYLLPLGKKYFSETLNLSDEESEAILKEHVRLCYDVCHFALGYENHSEVVQQLKENGIKIGKFQISAALKASLPEDQKDRASIKAAFAEFNEATYLHQVIAQKNDESLLRYRDLPPALADTNDTDVKEWRAHFHVPIFESNFGLLQSTQSDILEVLKLQEELQLCQHFEVETYTWGVLSPELKLALPSSISRELLWVQPLLDKAF
ncbi:metabolite traffic protein EboE [Albibacterium bauzanense]|uniref:Xylose isomerase-like TIM barrel protein n=1 Tax=Albibacterium bauzanense TaxID=653929 RepID=A0A4R1LZ62_9SPHI|nr:metabolite traffic protein EboE [Albibacterium bauzanense]TCK84858.1 hypothetical protein C8N28_0152 [Albibacterium bauzanense]